MSSNFFRHRFGSSRRRRAAKARSQTAKCNLSALLEQLETRRALAVTYLGVQQSNTSSTDESFSYVVDVDSTGTGQLWLRYEALQDRIDIADNPGFGTINNVKRLPVPGFSGPAAVPQNVAAPFSLDGLYTTPTAVAWNKLGETEDYSSGALTIRASAGTQIFIANGDPLPLALQVISSPTGGYADSVTIDGPIDSSVNKYALSPRVYNNFLTADTMTVRASMKTSSATQLLANSLINLQNVITSPLTNAYVGDGDFRLIAGASIQGNVGVYLGQTGSTVGFGTGGGNILVDGAINGSSVTLNTNSSTQPVTIQTGPSGLLSGGGSLTMFNSGLDGGRIDVRSSGFSVTNVSAGSPTGGVPDVGVAITQTTGNLRVAAVPKSRGQISLTSSAANSTITIDSNIETDAGLSLDAPVLDINSPIKTTAGDVVLKGNTVTIGSNVTAGSAGIGNVMITSRTGAVTVSSAAVVSAKDEIVSIDAKTNISSLASLDARTLNLNAGGSIDIKAKVAEVKATAASGIVIDNASSLLVRSAVTTAAAASGISVSAQGSLDVSSITTQNTGAVVLQAAAGIEAKDIRVKNGSASLAASSGDVHLTGTVVVQGTSNDLSLSATTGNVIVEPTASLAVADQLLFSAPAGRVLTPGQVTGVVVTQGGSGYTSAPTVTLDAGSGGTATPVVANGQVAGFELLAGGSGYVTAPKVRLVGGGGTNATAQAFITNGTVTKVIVTNPGTGYTSAPSVIFYDGSGSGAQANALLNGLSSVNVTNAGSGYLVPPAVVVSSGDGATVSPISVDANGGITKVNVSTGGGGYGLPPLVDIVDSSGSGSGASAVAQLTSGVTNYVVTNGGSGYSTAPAVTFSGGGGGTGASAVAVISGSVVTDSFSTTDGSLPDGGMDYTPYTQVVFNGDGSGALGSVTIDGSIFDSAVTAGGTYATAPTVTIDAPDPGGIQATATALLGLTDASFDTPVYPTSPLTPVLYSKAPKATLSGGGGTGAQVTVNIDATGLITGVSVTSPGTGYTSAPTVTLSGGTVLKAGSPISITANANNFQVSGLSITNSGSGYSFDPGVSFSTGTAQATVSVAGPILQVDVVFGGSGYSFAPTIDFVDSYGSGAVGPDLQLDASVIALQIKSPGSGYTSAPTLTLGAPDLSGGTQATATVSTSSVVSGIQVTQPGTGYDPATTTVQLIPVAGGGGAIAGAVTVDGLGVITGINIATAGQDYVAPPTVIISDSSGAGSGAIATAIVTGGTVTGFMIIDGGSNYDPLTTTVTLQSLGSGATAVANLNASGSVASVTVTNAGAGYSATNPPNVRLVPYGAGATATAAIGGGTVTGIAVTNGGGGYAVPPKVTITGGGGTGASGTAVISGVATVSASRLGWTALEAPLDAFISQFNTLAINLTGAGDVVVNKKAGSLVLEGASTKDGSVLVSAPVLTVKGAITVGDYAAQRNDVVSLTASAGDLTIDAAVGNVLAGALTRTPLSRKVTLSAPAGAIRASTATPGLVTGLELDFGAQSGATLRTDVDYVHGATTGVGAGIGITQNQLDSKGNPLKLTVGTPTPSTAGLTAVNGPITVNALDQIMLGAAVNAGATGTVTLSAAGQIVEAAPSAAPEVVAGSATLTSTSGRIDLDTAIVLLTASAPLSTIDIDNTSSDAIDLKSVTSRNGARVWSAGTVTATKVATTAGSADVRALGAAADVNMVSIAAPAYPITVSAGRSILQTNPAAASLVGSDATLTAGTGSLDIFVDVTSVSATAPETISIKDASSLQITGAVSSNNKTITLNVGGALSQSGAIRTSGALAITSTAGDVVLDNSANDVGSLTVSNPGRGITYRDASGLDIAAGGITGGAVTLLVAGALTQTGSITADALTINSTAGGPIAFNNSVNDVNTISITNPGNDISFTDADDVALGTFTGRNIVINAGGAISQPTTGAITATGTFTVNFTGSKMPLSLIGSNDFTSFSINNGTQSVAVNDINDLVVGGITGGAVTLTAGGNLTQTAGITASSLSATVTGGAIVLNGANDAGSVFLSNAGNAVTYNDVNAVTITGLTGGIASLSAGGDLTQTVPITAAALNVANSAGNVVLTNPGNAIGTLTGSNPGRAISYTDVDGLDVGAAGLSAGTIALVVGGNLTQSGTVAANALGVTASAGNVALTNPGNAVGSLTGSNPGRGFAFRDADGLDLGAAGINAGAVSLAVGGSLTQTGAITATSLAVTGGTGSVVLANEGNAVGGVFAASTVAGSISFANANGVQAGLVSAGGAPEFDGNVSLKAVTGDISLTDDVFALNDAVKLEARNGFITQAAGKTIYSKAYVWFAKAAPGSNTSATQVGRNLTQPGATLPAIVDNSTGTITLYDNSAMSGNIAVVAPNADKVVIAGALTAGPGGKIDLTGIKVGAMIEVRGDGNFVGSQVLVKLSPTAFKSASTSVLTWVVSGANASDAGTSLFNMLTRANAVMPILVASTSPAARNTVPVRMSTVASEVSSISVQQSLPVVNVPVTFVTPTTLVAAGAGVAGSGLRLASGAKGSSIQNLAFRGFGGSGLELDRVQGALVKGVTVSDGTTGISVSGLSTGTKILGCSLLNVQTGLALSSAGRLTFGGRRAGEANQIKAIREAAFVTGFSTGTQLVKTQYPTGGSTTIVRRNVRGLQIVK